MRLVQQVEESQTERFAGGRRKLIGKRSSKSPDGLSLRQFGQ
jgi:hypothetical protein